MNDTPANDRYWFEVHFLHVVLNKMQVADVRFSSYQEAVNWSNTHLQPGKKFFLYRVKRQFFNDYTATDVVK